jgi:hypothetical protein
LLTNKIIQKILHLLENGFSTRKTAELTGVSLDTVCRVASGKRSPNCSEPVQDQTADSINNLNLHGKTLQRYLKVRKKVEAEIIAGKRDCLAAINTNFNPKN